MIAREALQRRGLAALIRLDDPLAPLRLATFSLVTVGVAGLATVAPDPSQALAWLLTALGSWFSHWFRGRNWLVKAFLAVGMLYLLYDYLRTLFTSSPDARLPLANLLLWLQVLNSFDLPRRHNLRIAQLVGAILLVVTASVSRDLRILPVMLAATVTLVACSHLDTLLEFPAVPLGRRNVRAVGVAALGLLLVSAVVFGLVPRGKGGFLKQLPMSRMMELRGPMSSRIVGPGSEAGGVGNGGPGGGRGGSYYGFAERLDLNHRGDLPDEVVLKVRSQAPLYLRGMAYDVYDGASWRLSRPEDVETMTLATQPYHLRATMIGAGRLVLSSVYIEATQSNLVLLPGFSTQLYFPSPVLFRDGQGAYRSPVPLPEDLYYSIRHEQVAWQEASLAGASRLTPKLRAQYASWLALPEKLPARVADLARQWAGGEDVAPYLRLRALVQKLPATYVYDLDTPPLEPGRDQVDAFLFEGRRGTCEQFATAMAVMGRTLGIPTRLVTGYAPGRHNLLTGFYEVRGTDAHAWVEGFLPGVGWVPFDPTPGWSGPLRFVEDDGPPPILSALGAVYDRLGQRFWFLLAGLGAMALLVGWFFSEEQARLRGLRRTARSPEAYRATRIWLRVLAKLARHGHAVPATCAAGLHLEAVARDPLLAPLSGPLATVVSTYERLRFGKELPTLEDVRRLQEEVGALEAVLARVGRRTRRSDRPRLATGEPGMGHS
ncbi:MAG: transglutaminaseTgpA domain-containing protein [Candidatus Sericytochromatia bacterium]|nr:transglutaminaseTgpA domain-containing protein [Candidatus Sericytochromatia bacterium]